MQQIRSIQPTKDAVRETRREETLDADLVRVGEDAFQVRLQRTTFTAEAEDTGNGRTVMIDEETDVEEFSAAFVDAHYADIVPDAWTVVDAALAVPAVAPAPVSPGVPDVAATDTGRPQRPAVPLVDVGPGGPSVPVAPSPDEAVPEQPYAGFEPEMTVVRYEQEAGMDAEEYVPLVEDRQEMVADSTVPMTAEDVGETEDVAAPARPRVYEQGARSAEEVVAHMFAATELDGTVELVEDYGTTGDVDDHLEEAYWIDIDGMDMDRTEYFINGELADDAINAYDLGPGDTITFVEHEVFETGDGADSCGGDLYLEDLAPVLEAENVESYTVSAADVLEGSVGAGTVEYTAQAA